MLGVRPPGTPPYAVHRFGARVAPRGRSSDAAGVFPQRSSRPSRGQLVASSRPTGRPCTVRARGAHGESPTVSHPVSLILWHEVDRAGSGRDAQEPVATGQPFRASAPGGARRGASGRAGKSMSGVAFSSDETRSPFPSGWVTSIAVSLPGSGGLGSVREGAILGSPGGVSPAEQASAGLVPHGVGQATPRNTCAPRHEAAASPCPARGTALVRPRGARARRSRTSHCLGQGSPGPVRSAALGWP